MVITDSLIIRTIHNATHAVVFKDDRLPCLRCRITPKGASFYIHCTVSCVRLRKQLGRYPKISIDVARATVWQLMRESIKPIAIIQPQDSKPIVVKITFSRLLELYANNKRMKEATKESYEGFLRNSGLIALFVQDVTPEVFLGRFNEIFSVYPVKARKVASIIKSLTRWYSNYSGVPLDEPTRLISALTGVGIHSSNCRTRRLSVEQLPLFWRVLSSRSALERDAITFALLTAMRKNEVLGLTVDNVTVVDGHFTVTLPTTKNGKPHLLPLIGVALEVVKRRLIASPDRLFPTQSKHAFNALKDAGVVISWHDLRRSWASFAVSNGVSDSMVKRVLNHSAVGVTARHYSFFDDASIIDVLLKVERVMCADYC
jgi:integrase